nr:putative phosphatidate phosphatase isoform X2 [Bactrocera oleae]XP_014098579.1 putative phosphatidate phosphatase isoform X2 [Bactrocera oleae]XP_014098580.1 putative phosphatidate phosphatase isoform X2 [Bactrocera oleae]
MSSLRPTSISDAALLPRLDNLSSNSEPSSPISQVGMVQTTVAFAPPPTKTNFSTKPLPVIISSSQYKNNNNNVSLTVNGYLNGSDNASSEPVNATNMNFKIGMSIICYRIISDLLILGCVGLPILAFHLWGTPYKRGFFCDDKSLKYPFKKNTVDNWMLFLMCFIIPISIITTVEFFLSQYNRTHGLCNMTYQRYFIWQLEIADWIVESYKKIGLLIFGSGVGQLTMEIAKYSIGRLRPHFFAVCEPVMVDSSTCNDTVNADRYIEEFICTGDATPRMIKQMSLSFPSGHASFACFAMVYITIYLEKRMTWERCKMVKHFIQFLLLMFSWYTGLTRISDNQHHTTDVLSGFAIGAFYAIVLTRTMW